MTNGIYIHYLVASFRNQSERQKIVPYNDHCQNINVYAYGKVIPFTTKYVCSILIHSFQYLDIMFRIWHVVGPCHHGMACPWVADGGVASRYTA